MSDNVYFDPQWFQTLTGLADDWMPDVALMEGEVRRQEGPAVAQHPEPLELQQPHSFAGHSFTELVNFGASIDWPLADYFTAPTYGVPAHDHHYTSVTVPRIHSEDQSTSASELPQTRPVATSIPPFGALEAGALAATINIDPRCKITFLTDSGTSAASLSTLFSEHDAPPIVFSYGIDDGIDSSMLTKSITEGPMIPLPTSSGSLSTMTAIEGSSEFLPVAEITTLVSPTPTSSIPARGIGFSGDRNPSEGFSCTQQGCRSRTIFKRKYELKRHIKSVHEKATKFPCPVITCYKKGSESLTRPDKFREHLRVSHVYDDLSECPNSSCSVILPLLLLQLHVKSHSLLEVKHMRAVGRYMEVNDRVRGCPVEGCRKSLPAQDLHDHLAAAHTEEQRESNRVAITTGGFDHVRCTIICPVCKFQSPSFEEALEHLVQLHIWTDYGHYKSVRNRVQHVLKRITATSQTSDWYLRDTNLDFYSNDTGWPSFFGRIDSHSLEERCPQCSAVLFKEESHRRYSVVHELDLLRQSDAFFEHRLSLLKLFPSFETHPVFAPDWPMERKTRKETIEKHFSSTWIADHLELVYGPVSSTGSGLTGLNTTDKLT